jgi:hypothetical protein
LRFSGGGVTGKTPSPQNQAGQLATPPAAAKPPSACKRLLARSFPFEQQFLQTITE